MHREVLYLPWQPIATVLGAECEVSIRMEICAAPTRAGQFLAVRQSASGVTTDCPTLHLWLMGPHHGRFRNQPQAP